MVNLASPPSSHAGPLPRRRWLVALLRALARPLSDRAYLHLAHWMYYRRWPDYAHPRTMQEHIQAYLLRCRDPALVTLADKVAMRDHVARTLGPGHTVPLLGVWRHEDEVPLAHLPYPLVLKPSHLSGRVELLAKHEPAEEARLRKLLRGWLRRDHSRSNREWFYAQIPPRVIAEPLLQDAAGGVPADVKAYVIGGRVRYFQVDAGRFARPTRNLYSPDWHLLPVRTTLPRRPSEPPPHDLPSLVEIAERLAAPFEFLRVDFYVLGERFLIGELTHSPGAGFGRFYPPQFGEDLAAFWVSQPSAQSFAPGVLAAQAGVQTPRSPR
jgi:teichuronopeptide biosynthesis TupA-like protein